MTNWQWCFGLIEFGAAWWYTDRAWRLGILGMWMSEESRRLSSLPVKPNVGIDSESIKIMLCSSGVESWPN